MVISRSLAFRLLILHRLYENKRCLSDPHPEGGENATAKSVCPKIYSCLIVKRGGKQQDAVDAIRTDIKSLFRCLGMCTR